LKRRKKKIAVTADDVSQAIGLDKAAYVKGLLNIPAPPHASPGDAGAPRLAAKALERTAVFDTS